MQLTYLISPPPLSPFQGAFALDPVTGPVTVRAVTPLPANFTASATPAPFILTYIATGAVGGLTATATRSVAVVDPCRSDTASETVQQEFTCLTTLQCSINGRSVGIGVCQSINSIIALLGCQL